MRAHVILLLAFFSVAATVASDEDMRVDPAAHAAEIRSWRAERLARLTAEDGWLTLVGLYWLKPGENTFGRAPGNAIVLDHSALTHVAGSFVLEHDRVRFNAPADAGITLDGKPVTSVDMRPDSSGSPTILASGTLRFLVIERAGRVGVRVRDVAHPLRTHFAGLDYFPIDAEWVRRARFHSYDPVKRIPIVNILGMVVDMDSPGYLAFKTPGHEWLLDALVEGPDAEELFLMFADATSGRETYGAGRFLYVPLPVEGKVLVDFNKAYNPPCAFNEFATCPLPPQQNRLSLRIEAGELSYRSAH